MTRNEVVYFQRINNLVVIETIVPLGCYTSLLVSFRPEGGIFHANVLGSYNRGEARPFAEMAAKLAELLDVSIDWLAGHTDLELDKKMIQRIQEMIKMNIKSKEHVFIMLDEFIKLNKLQSVLN